MNQPQITHRNHYVPAWYQKGFLVGSRKKLQYLDLDPRRELPDGREMVGKKLELRGPRGCFWEFDLYTRRFGDQLNDDIEKLLFGEIDRKGALAVRAFIGTDLKEIHDNFQSFFDYLNAQKLRTPKGLDWVQSMYPSLTQSDLMLEMQELRQMYCAMWFESVREIVSAKDSDVKFIATDHPVTIYNAACAPDSPACLYPQDPSIGLKGTQTVFALDADHCLILTNFEYARDPSGVDLLSARENERYLSQTFARTDAMIRTRTLTRDQVVGINLLLKAGSRKYVAGYEESWLFPEQAQGMARKDIGEILLPPRDQLGRFGGEMWIGYADGSTRYQDAFGRTDEFHKFLKKKTAATALAANDSCGCGSGRKYKKCCQGVALDDRLPWDVYSIRERNLMFAGAIIDILGLNRGKSWDDVRRNLSDDQVRDVHVMLEGLWPKDTNIADLLPRPDKRVFRAVYLGFVDPRTIALSVISSLLYFDEIVIVNPFPNPVYYKRDFSPTQSPAQHRSQMLKNVVVLMALEPFIDVGVLHLVPDPMEFNSDFRRVIMEMSRARGANWALKDDETQSAQALCRDELERWVLRLSEEEQRHLIRKSRPGITPELVERSIKCMKEKLSSDPLALLQPVSAGSGREMKALRGMNLELALFFAHLTGAAVYTDEPAHWRQLHEHANVGRTLSQQAQWSPLVEKVRSLKHLIESEPTVVFEARKAGKLGRMRRVFRRIWNTALTRGADADSDENLMRLVARLESFSCRAGAEWDICSATASLSERLLRRIELSVSPAGFSMNTVRRLLVTSGRVKYAENVPLALFLTLEGIQDEAQRL